MSFALILMLALVAQAVLPSYRLLIVLAGAALSCLGAVLSRVASVATVFAGVPWNVLMILVKRAGLKDLQGTRFDFGFKQYLPVGLLGFSLILAVAIGRTLWVISG